MRIAILATCAAALASRTAAAQGGSAAYGGQTGGDIGASGLAPPSLAREAFVDQGLVGTPSNLRTVPRAPTLPDLTHRAFEMSYEHTLAAVRPKSDSADRLSSHLFHLDAEFPLTRFLYVGAEWGFAAARSPEQQNARFLPGQPQVFARVVYAGPHEDYSLGAGVGLVGPIVTYDDLDDTARREKATTSSLVGIVRPWDLSTFLDRRVTTRPWIDLRIGRRKFIVQVRQGLDVAIRSGVPGGASAVAGLNAGRVGDIELLSISTLFLGLRASQQVTLGVEAWEVYLLKTAQPIADRDRSVFALSPSIRFFFKWVEPAVSLLMPIGQPLLNSVDSYIAMRLDLRIWFGGFGG